eukprot:c11188_g1_i1 orf=437-1207(-)
MEFDEDNPMDISYCLAEPQEINNDFLVEVCKDLQIVDPSSSSSVWYMTNEESLSSVDDAVEQSSESWRVGCISDSGTSNVQELVHHTVNPSVNVVISKSLPKKASGLVPNSTIPNLVHPSPQSLKRNQHMQSAGSVRIKKSGQDRTGQSQPLKECSRPVSLQPSNECSRLVSLQPTKECSSPVLAYPFALVKPIGIQGDITLQDINQRINTTPCSVKTRFAQPKNASSPYSGKSVLALTKIYTEGKGTITIMRTKN